MATKWLSLWIVPLLFLCLAFDPADDNDPHIDRQTYLSQLIKIEARLLATASNTTDEERGVIAPGRNFGTDPYRIRHLPQSDHYLILQRNASKIVLCDSHLQVIASSNAPRHPVAFDLVKNNILLVGGELSGTLHRYKIGSNRIEGLSGIELQNVVSVRDLVYVPEAGSIFLLDDFFGRLIQVKLPSNGLQQAAIQFEQHSFPIGNGPLQILSVKNHLIINLMLDHTILIVPLQRGVPDFSQAARIVNAGPFWSVATLIADEKLIIAAGGIENRPLSRTTGEFGYLDSFLYLFTLEKDQQGRFRWHAANRNDARRYRAFNLSERNVLTPKAMAFTDTGNAIQKLLVTGYGAERAIEFTISSDGVVTELEFSVMPGISDVVVSMNRKGRSLVYTSPLLDRIVKHDLSTGAVLNELAPKAFHSPERSIPSHLGEILFFTDLMSPNNSSHGELSRFTCEACHFEGHIDGRVHFTGRENIHTTTKPIHGLANNVPLFSRAGDDSLSSMVMAEFQVANQNRKGFFEIQKDRHRWMSTLDHWPEKLTPLELREGLLSFFVDFNPGPNPWRIKHKFLTKSARRGLVVFRDRCSDCHQAIRSTRTESGVGFEQWEHWLTDENLDLVWGVPFFARTGLKPYVDPAGSRVPSLRRVWMKYPLFTNGTSQTIRDVLSRFRHQDSTVWHHYDGGESMNGGGVKSLTPKEISDLETLLHYF